MPFTLCKAPVPLAAKQPHSIILPPPCLTVGMVFLGLKASPFLLQTYCWALCPNSSIFVSSDHRTFLQKVLPLSMWSAANFSQALRCCFWSKGSLLARQPLSPWRCKTRLTVDTDTCVPAASNSWQICFLVVLGWLFIRLTNFLSTAGDSLHFLPDRGGDKTMPSTLYLQTIVCTVALGTCSYFEMAPSDFPVLFKSMICFFRSVLSSFDFTIVPFVAVCIQWALFKWPQRSHQL